MNSLAYLSSCSSQKFSSSSHRNPYLSLSPHWMSSIHSSMAPLIMPLCLLTIPISYKKSKQAKLSTVQLSCLNSSLSTCSIQAISPSTPLAALLARNSLRNYSALIGSIVQLNLNLATLKSLPSSTPLSQSQLIIFINTYHLKNLSVVSFLRKLGKQFQLSGRATNSNPELASFCSL